MLSFHRLFPLFLTLLPACGQSEAHAPEGAGSALRDEPLAPARVRLLELAFDTASAIPPAPHLKTRTRTQEEVLEVALELGQLARVAELTPHVEGWRQGVLWAELALRCARAEHQDLVAPFLARAEQEESRARARQLEAEGDELVYESPQDWHAERIRGGIARVQALLGHAEEAARLQAGASDAEAGHAALGVAERASEEELEPHLAALREAARIGNFELAQNALAVCTRLYERFYAQAELRERLAAEIRAGWRPVPLPERLEVLCALTEAALAHADETQARALLSEARALLASASWEPDARLPIDARLAGLRHRAGEPDEARAELDQALAFYATERAHLVDIFRARALRPVAENLVLVGDSARAAAVYATVLGEGRVNPNACPRAEDLSATALSMARSGFEPDAELWERLFAARAELTAPW